MGTGIRAFLEDMSGVWRRSFEGSGWEGATCGRGTAAHSALVFLIINTGAACQLFVERNVHHGSKLHSLSGGVVSMETSERMIIDSRIHVHNMV